MVKVYAIDGVVPVVDPSTYVHPTAVLIGDVIIGPGCFIGPSAALRADFGRIVIGSGCNVQDNCVVHTYPNGDTVIEDWGHVGHGSVLHCCVVRKNALIGMNSVVMDGAEIGESSIVAAMAFVRAGMQVPARHLVAGIPAKIVRELTDQDITWKQDGTREYQRLAQRCLATMVETEALTAVEPNRPRLSMPSYESLHVRKGK